MRPRSRDNLMDTLAKVRSDATFPQRTGSLISMSAWKSKDEGEGTLPLAPRLRRATGGREGQAGNDGRDLACIVRIFQLTEQSKGQWVTR